MKLSAGLACFVVATAASMTSQTVAETVQTAANVFHSRPFLWLEAESYNSNVDGGTAGNGWKVVSKATAMAASRLSAI